jgi:hypothetical protein
MWVLTHITSTSTNIVLLLSPKTHTFWVFLL